MTGGGASAFVPSPATFFRGPCGKCGAQRAAATTPTSSSTARRRPGCVAVADTSRLSSPLSQTHLPYDAPQPRQPTSSARAQHQSTQPVEQNVHTQPSQHEHEQQQKQQDEHGDMVALFERMRADRDRVDIALDAVLEPRLYDHQSAKLVHAIRHSLLAKGKRIRPILVLASYDMFATAAGGGTSVDPSSTEYRERRDRAAMPAALAVEMIHTMSLIHDDLPAMDNDDFRRGLPTCHKAFGENTAILAGDALLAFAYEVVARDTMHVDPARVVRVIAKLAQSVGPAGLAGGQIMDLQCEGRDDVSLEDLIWIHTHKTATLLRVSVAAGALLGGASDEDLARVEEFAVKTGLAFQIADDLLDVTASTETLGKTAGKDVAANKATYPKLLGLAESRRMAESLIREAKQSLEPYGSRANTLLGLADFIINRPN